MEKRYIKYILLLGMLLVIFSGIKMNASEGAVVNLYENMIWVSANGSVITISGNVSGDIEGMLRVYADFEPRGYETGDEVLGGSMCSVDGREFNIQLSVSFEEDQTNRPIYIYVFDDTGYIAWNMLGTGLDECAPEAMLNFDYGYEWNDALYVNSSTINLSLSNIQSLSGIGHTDVLLNGENVTSFVSAGDVYGLYVQMEPGENMFSLDLYSRAGLKKSFETKKICYDPYPPELTVSLNGVIYEADGIRFINREAEICAVASDCGDGDFGLRYVSISINGQEIKETVSDNTALSVNISDYISSAIDFDVSVCAMDLAGNTVMECYQLRIDEIAPVIEYAVDEHNDNMISEEATYTLFSKDEKTINIKTSDNEGGSGVKYIVYYAVNDGIEKEKQYLYPDYNGEAKITVSGDFKGCIYFYAVDNTGNISSILKTKEIIIESESCFVNQSMVNLELSATDFQDEAGNPLYSEAVKVSVSVNSLFAGIDYIEWKIVTDDGEVVYGMEKNFDGNDGTLLTLEKDRNLVTRISGELWFDYELNDMELIMNIYDNAGYMMTRSIIFSKDGIAPVLQMDLSGESNIDADDGFYKSSVQLLLTLTERNMDTDNMEILINGQRVNEATWQIVNNDATKVREEEKQYICNLELEKDGEYEIAVSYADRAGNIGEPRTAYFCVDKTSPVANIEFDDEYEGEYINSSRQVLIEVEDMFFDPERVNIDLYKDGEIIQINGKDWSQNGGKNSLFISLEEDGVYYITLDVKDRAGNESGMVISNVFIIDKTFPVIEVEGVAEGASYNGECIVIVRTYDVNYDYETLQVRMSGKNNGEINQYEKKLVDFSGEEIAFSDFEYEKNMDDKYTLWIAVEDMAGNQSEKTIEFVINRNGSEFAIEESAGKYNGAYLNEIGVISFTETNYDEIKDKDRSIYIIYNGILSEIAREDLLITKAESEEGKKVYTYDINCDKYLEDGKYEIVIVTKDEAGNINDTRLPEKDFSFSFFIDNTSPNIIAVNLSEGMSVDSKRFEAQLYITDNLYLDDVRIYVNGKETEYTYEGSSYYFGIDERALPSEIEVVATDRAGNEYKIKYDDILVSTNGIFRWYHNESVLTGIVMEVLALGIAFIRRFRGLA